MCFSAAASFAVSGLLTAMGTVSVVRNVAPSHRMLASVPLLFAAQQAVEGIVWLTVGADQQSVIHRLGVHLFLIFALMVWPIWSPLAMFQIETNKLRRRRLFDLFRTGVCVSGLGFVLLFWAGEPSASVAEHSIRYDLGLRASPAFQAAYLVLYLVPTTAPFFVSRFEGSHRFGVLLLCGLAVTLVVQRDALTSVWCFFAAVLSGSILVSLARVRRLVHAV